jgi:repressor LexA
MSIKNMAQKIKELRKQRNMTLEEVANIVGVGKSTVRKWETGMIANMKRDKIADLAKALGTTPAFLMGWDEEAYQNNINANDYGLRLVTKKRFPMLGEIACGKPIFANEEHESYIDASSSIDADFCLTAKGDSMINAGIKDGDVVFIKMMDMVNNGDIAAVIIDDEATLKRVYYYPEQQKLILSPENAKYPPLIYENEQLDTITVLGKAVCYMSML